MTPEQWQQVEALFHAARAKAPGDRAAFLDEACAGDLALRGEVESLMAHGLSGEEPLRESPWPMAEMATQTTIQPGAMLSHYRVEASVGAGGMGEVFRALDTRLNRKVAIKVSRAIFSERFRREAQALSALNNPHICTLFDVGPDFLVMELLEGETLAARLERGPLPFIETLRYGAQIADALADAHTKGITHRDLKPANIMITRTGVKLLDFGLAAVEGYALTQTGVVMGTPAYMAPEQARGTNAGPQTDIYALGLVLQQMATGRLPTVKTGEPVVIQGLPESLAHVVERCLEETPSSRWQNAAEVRALLGWAARTPLQSPARRAPRLLSWVLAGVAVLGLVGVTAMLVTQRRLVDPAPPVVRFEIPLPGIGNPAFTSPSVGVSADGRQLAYAGGDRPITVRALDVLENRSVGADPNREAPFFSPDGEWLAFVGFGMGLIKTPVKGGAEFPIVSDISFNPSFGGSWGPDNVIVFATGAGLFRVPADGGKPELLIEPQPARGELFYAWPEILPDGKSVLFAIVPQESESGSQIAVLNLETRKTRVLFRGGNRPRYLNSGHLIYVAGQTLEARAFDLTSLEVRGEPVSFNIEVELTPPYGGLAYDVSPSGTLAYLPAKPKPEARTLVWVHRDGREELFAAPGMRVNYPRISPDGLSVAVDVANPAKRDIWVIDALHPTMKRQVSPSPRPDGLPEWSPDGKFLAFATENNGVFNLYRVAQAGGSPERLFESASRQMPAHYASETQLLVTFDGQGTDIGLLTIGTPSTFTPLLQDRYQESAARLSPDGRWMAYQSDESGRLEVYVRPFPDVHRKRWTISSMGGRQPRWSPDGRELFYVNGKNGDMYTTKVRLVPEFEHEPPHLLFADKNYAIGGGTSYDVAKDGRFLMVKGPDALGEPQAPRIAVIANWIQDVKRRVPVK